MASDIMRVRLHLRQVRVRAVVVDTAEELRVWVESTLSRLRCPHSWVQVPQGLRCPDASHHTLRRDFAKCCDLKLGFKDLTHCTQP